MIKREIIVEYYFNLETMEAGIKREDVEEDTEKYQEIVLKKRTFHIFKNNGKVSKTDKSTFDVVNAEAEKLLAQQLEFEQRRPVDQKRANELAHTINVSSHWETTNEWKIIKAKTSNSDWYKGKGLFNARSVYYYQVPIELAEEAKELFEIRKRHQNDIEFDFYQCTPTYLVSREADHDNFSHSGNESWIEKGTYFKEQ